MFIPLSSNIFGGNDLESLFTPVLVLVALSVYSRNLSPDDVVFNSTSPHLKFSCSFRDLIPKYMLLFIYILLVRDFALAEKEITIYMHDVTCEYIK